MNTNDAQSELDPSINFKSASGGLSDNKLSEKGPSWSSSPIYSEFYIQQLSGNVASNDNQEDFFILSVTGNHISSSSTGTIVLFIVDSTKPPLDVKLNLISDTQIDPALFIKDLSIITGLPIESFRIISIVYSQIQQSIKLLVQKTVYKIIIELQILPTVSTIDSHYISPHEILDWIIVNKKSSNQTTAYFSGIQFDSIQQKCDNGMYLENCNYSSDNTYTFTLPLVLASFVILITSLYFIYKYKKYKNRIIKIQKIKDKTLSISNLPKTSNLSQQLPEEKNYPAPLINTFVQQINLEEKSVNIDKSSTFPETSNKAGKKRLETVLPNKYAELGKINPLASSIDRLNNIKYKRNFRTLVPLEFPKLPTLLEQHSPDSFSDSSESVSSSEQSSASNTPSVSNSNSYIDSISYSESNSTSKNILQSVKPMKD